MSNSVHERKGSPGLSGADWLTYLGLCVSAIFLGLPFYWMIITALKPLHEVALYPPRWLPTSLRWANFVEAWQAAPFARFTLNSLIVSVCACALQILFALLMAYAFVYIRFPFKHVLFFFVLATMMVPDEVKLLPNYLVLKSLDWVNTYQGLILPLVAQAFPVFVLVQWFRSQPRDLIEAARVDGAGHLRTLWYVVVPSSRAVLAVLAVFAFANRWNDYLWALIATNKTVMRTLPVGLAYLKGTQEGGNRWNLLMAAALLAALPVLGVFLGAVRAGQKPLLDDLKKFAQRQQT